MLSRLANFVLLLLSFKTALSTAQFVSEDSLTLDRRTSGVTCSTFEPLCPNLNFYWHTDNQNVMHYSMTVNSVTWISGNTYELTIAVKGAENIDLKYLWSLKIIGVNGPQGTVQLYGKNENTYIIDNPTDYTATFQVYGQQSSDDACKVLMPSFQIQYEYLQGDAAQYASTWKWGQTSFDLMTGCSADNNNNSNADFPTWYWTKECGSCGSPSN